ncbi:protein MALE DISCOVERER 2 isoform X2 [Ziziphus jujuba]|uniref:Protein MALE DISCOVERER 2 isoform X2 n=1 Tax=Ziziphus jujuba TaxID=326968 RepID=A0A6P3ZFN8_ZIZJJ|nr:protein MALE DISCOVERER 2 isoform X2 [Ziziphus jujuba]
MGGRWNPFEFGFSYFLVLILVSSIGECSSLNDEGLLLFAFRLKINSDPFGVLANWNPNDEGPCLWSGVHCVDGEVQMLNMTDLSLEGTLAPELGKLGHLRALVLYKNHFSGEIPKEIGELTELELLDLRDNNLSGKIPADIGRMLSLKRLLLCDNSFEGSIPLDLARLNMLCEFQFDEYLASSEATGIACVNRKFSYCLRVHGHEDSCYDHLPASFELNLVQNSQKYVSFTRRKLLEQASNLAAAPAPPGGESPSGQIIALPTTRSSGAFPAIPNAKTKPANPPAIPPSSAAPPPQNPSHEPSQNSTVVSGNPTQQNPSSGSSGNLWKYAIIVAGVAVLLIVAAAMLCMCRSQAVKTIGPWKTGISGQLQKAFITGVPKLNRLELETACEDFSNIINTIDGCTVYKGTLSSGVEIAVASTSITSLKDWTKTEEMTYRKKIDTLSRVNHKNFVNLIGYCEDDNPFVRMMVFEYAPNGSLFEHLHVKEVEHLDWNARMRILMGTAYCLQYMHHDLNPPVSHYNLNSSAIYLTDDYAAKIAEVGFWSKMKPKSSNEDEKENSELPPPADPETNIYSFGILLLEIISGKLPYSEEQGHLVNWAAEYLNDKRSISYMIDPTLKSFKNNELDVICEVIQDCIQPNPRQRPTMKEITSKLREVINISAEQATPRLSPLWWAELEILSVEAT